MEEMPTEIRELTEQSFDTDYGGNGSTTAPERTDSFRSSSGAENQPGSNGVYRRKRTTLTDALSADNSPTRAPSIRPPSHRRGKDYISVHRELTSKGSGRPVENGNGRPPASRSRGPDGIPPTSKSSSNSGRQSLDDVSKSHHRGVSEITAIPSSPEKDDPDPDYHSPPQTQVQKLMERRASSQFLNRMPSPADRTFQKDYSDDVKQDGLRRSSSFEKRSALDRKSTPSAGPLSQSFTQTGSSSSSGARRTEQSTSTSSSTASRQSETRGGNNGSSKPPGKKQEAAKLSSPGSRADSSKAPSKASSNDGFVDLRYNAGNDNLTSKSSSPELWQGDEPAKYKSAMRSNAWLERSSGFRTGVDVADDARKRSSTGGKWRQEYASDLATGSRRSSPGRRFDSKQDDSSSSTRASDDSWKQEDQADSARKHRRRGSTSGSLKQDNAADSGAGTREGMINNKASNLVPYRSGTSLQRNDRNVRWLLKGVAAASHNYGGWVPYDELVPYPDDIARLNDFLTECRNEVEAGVPGRYLTVVLGHENSDLDSIMSTLTYAYFLSSIEDGEESKIFVPVINMRHEDLALHTEAVWLFKVAGVDTSKLLFVNQISLQYYHRFGNLKLVLVDHSRLAPHQETLQDAVIEIVDHNVIDDLYPWVPIKDIQQVGSCCTIVTERFVTEAPELLAGRGVNRLLLGPILLDTANLDPKSARCTARDQCMAAFLLNGAGRYGYQGFFRLLKKMQFDISTLRTIEILRKDIQQWKMGPGKTNTYGLKGRIVSAALSTLGVPLKEIMIRKGILEDLRSFGRTMKLDLHLIVTAYYDRTERYKREILIVPGDKDLKDHVRACFRPHKSDLQLSYILIPGLPDDILVYKQGLVTASRSILRQILKDYFEM